MTSQGGDSGGGVIYNYDELISYDSVVYTMPATPETPYYTHLLQASDGNLYGMTEAGGSAGSGALFKYCTSGVLTILVNFTGAANGNTPRGSLIQASDGNLYGMTLGGGSLFLGTLFKCTTSGTLTTLVTFTGAANGSYPFGSLVQASDGNLYGMTSQGGSSGLGTLFRCSTSGVLTTLVNFSGSANGSNPNGSLIEGTDGNLYGMTKSAGSHGFGTIFKCTTSGTLTTLVNFNDTNGANPLGTLIQAADGNLYGMTYGGGVSGLGTIIKCTTTGTLSILVNFNDTNGAHPYGSLMQASDGNLYGMATQGDSSGNGALFKCTTAGILTNLVDFNGADNGANPGGSLIQDTDGNLYGMTYEGGESGNGTIFKCTTSGVLTTLVVFGVTSIGYNPGGSLIQAKDGNLYGLTYGGGSSGYDGTVFTYNTRTNALSVLVNFNDTNGASPYGSLMQASDGNLYGMTNYGGTSSLSNNSGGSAGLGTIFKCTTTGTLTTLVNFNDTNGAWPFGSLIQATDGNLYGLTYQGGTSDSGTLFKCTTSGTLTTLVNFNNANGANPFGSLIQASDGNLYGMTLYGGSSNDGTIFTYNISSGTLTTLVTFNGTNGSNPFGSLIQALDGNLYGTTEGGGSADKGTLFKCTTSGTLTTLVTFNGANGANPSGSLIQASDSNFYGYTLEGGSSGRGIVFKYTPSGTFSTLIEFNDSVNGANPQYGNLLEVMSVSIAEICGDTSLAANVRGAESPFTYSWSNGATTSGIKVATAGTYSVSVTDARGINVSSGIIYSGPLSVKTGSGIATCNGNSVALSATGSGGTGNITYTWMPGGLTGASPGISPSATTTYTVTAVDAGGCTSTAYQAVTVTQSPVININGTSDIIQGSSDTLIAGGACSYSWASIGTTSDSVIVSPTSTTTYTVSGSCNGCSSVDTFTVHVKVITGINSISSPGSVLVYPNPGNGKFIIEIDNGQLTTDNEETEIDIYNLIGEKVASSNSSKGGGFYSLPSGGEGWAIDLSAQPAGMYFVKVEANKKTETVKFVKLQ